MDLNLINYTVDQGVAYVCFCGNDKYNIYTTEMEKELTAVWNDISYRNDVRAVIFSGKENAFLTGMDVKLIEANNIQKMQAMTQRCQELLNRIDYFRGPTLAMIDGYATGFGFQLALACDFRFATPYSSFAFTEVKLGIIPASGGTQRLPRVVGLENAKMMIFSGNSVDSKEAKYMGLVSRILSREQIMNEANNLIRSILKNAPLAIANSKTCINLGYEMSIEQGLALERNAYFSLCLTDDAIEGVDAFLNKREPIFKGL